MQEKGEVDEAELRALEEDVTGRVRFVSHSILRITIDLLIPHSDFACVMEGDEVRGRSSP